jgi:hypothetical protein
MNRALFKSIGAIVAGLIAVVILSIATDIVLVTADAMKIPFDKNPVWFIVVVIAYRNVYAAAGCYLTARLAPSRPMRHAMISGWIGLGLAITGAIVMKEEGPAWYAISLIVLALPSAWLGGKLYSIQNTK